jgi:hypothetical protein
LVRGVIPQTAMPASELVELYNQVKADQIKFAGDTKSECLALTAPKLSGPLLKRGRGFFGRWNRYYFVLTLSFLYYFESTRALSDMPLGVIDVSEVNVQPLEEDQLVILAQGEEIRYVKFLRGKPVPVRGVREIQLKAPSMSRRNKWIYRIRTWGVYTGFVGPAELGLTDVADNFEGIFERSEEEAVMCRSSSHTGIVRMEDVPPERPEPSPSVGSARRSSVTAMTRPMPDLE